MKIDPVSITVHLDPQHEIEEVWKFALEAFEDLFYPVQKNERFEKLEPMSGEKLDKSLQATYLDSIPHLSNDDLNLYKPQRLRGVFKIDIKEKNTINFLSILSPYVGHENNRLKLEWGKSILHL